jgi:hypothetical protein
MNLVGDQPSVQVRVSFLHYDGTRLNAVSMPGEGGGWRVAPSTKVKVNNPFQQLLPQ